MSQLDGGHGIDLVLVSLESELRGFKNKLAFVRFCRRLGVKLRACGRLQFVSRKELEAAILRQGEAENDLDSLVDSFIRQGA